MHPASPATAAPLATYTTTSNDVAAEKISHALGSLLVPALLLWFWRKRPGCILAILAFVGLGVLSMLAIVFLGPQR
jgi:hypothetical protein